MTKEKGTLLRGLVPEAQREAFSAMTPLKKLGYIWHYYWLYIIIILTIAGVIAGVTADVLSAPRDVQLYVMLQSPAEGEQEALEKGLERDLHENGFTGSVQTEAVTYDPLSSNHAYEQINISVKTAARCVDVVVCDEELYGFLLSVNGLAQLDDALPDGLDIGASVPVYGRAGSDEAQSETPIEPDEHIYAVKLPDGRYVCIAVSGEHPVSAMAALGVIARGGII